MIDLQSWENTELGKVLSVDGVKADAGQCSQVPIAWFDVLFPGVPRAELLPEAGAGKGVDAWAGHPTKYAAWIENNTADKNQLPLPGDVLVIESNKAIPYPHTGVIKSASISGYSLIQQNAPKIGSPVNDSSYAWSARPVMGWFRPQTTVEVVAPAAPVVVPPPAAAPVASTHVGWYMNFPASVVSQWTYNPDGPYDAGHHAHVLEPQKYGGYSRQITKDLGNGVYVINTDSFGPQAVIQSGAITVTEQPTLATS